MKIQELIPDFMFEDKTHECKVRLNQKDPLGWLKTIDGFANEKGGMLLLGVEDGTYEVQGYTAMEADKEKLLFASLTKSHLDPVPVYDIVLLPYLSEKETRYVLKISIQESPYKPVVLRYEGMNLFFVRHDGYTESATMEELRSMFNAHRSVPYDETPTDIPYRRENFTELQKFALEHSGSALSDKVLASLPFFDKNGNLKQGSLLFQDGFKNEKVRVSMNSYPELTKGSDRVLASENFSGNLIEDYQAMHDFITSRMSHGYRKLPDRRVDIDSYPERALFEALINALAHRDYTMEGCEISVDLYPNRLVITTPGSFYGEEELKPTRHLKELASQRRNNLICSVFVACKAMEARGTGFEKIEEAYADADEMHKPYVYSRFQFFTIVLPDLNSPLGVSLDSESFDFLKKIENESKYDRQILAECYTAQKDAKDLASALGLSNSSFFRKKILKNLVDQGLLLEKTEGKTTYYATNRDFIHIR